jgi:hypothetical protein
MEEQRTGNRGAKDRTSGIEPQKGDTGTVDRQGTVEGGQEDKEESSEDRGRETRSRAMR